MSSQDQFTIQEMKHRLSDGSSFRLTVTGTSMRPFLTHKKDSVTVSPVTSEIKRGDILFYECGDAIVRLHRVQKVSSETLYLVGDGQVRLEPVARTQVLGRVTEIQKADGRIIPVTSVAYRIKVFFWQLIRPIRWVFLKRKG